MLRRYADDLAAGGGVVHSFDGSAEEAATLLELPHMYIGMRLWLCLAVLSRVDIEQSPHNVSVWHQHISA